MSADLGQNQGDELLDGPGGLFKKIRNHISTPQGRGQVFERLIKAFLKEDPLFKERFKQVWLWADGLAPSGGCRPTVEDKRTGGDK